MITSEIKSNYKNGKPIVTQKVIVKCENCGKEKEIKLYCQIKSLEKYGKDLCRGCMLKIQIQQGKRVQQYIKAGKSAIEKMKGKTHVELYGKEKAEKMRKINSEKNSGTNNKNYGGTWHGTNPGLLQKGKNYEEIHGKEKSDIIKKKISIKSSGKNNPMYGKPSPNGSGNGWCGWYKKYFFRSLKELSFIIYYIERFNFKCESGEKKKYRIKYKDFDNNDKNYFPDFILNDKYMIEIKPKHLFNTFINKRKKEAATIFCIDNDLKYKLITPIKKISFEEIKKLVDSKEVKFIDRYKEKYENLEKNQIIGYTTSG